MASKTTNYNLTKPAQNDYYDVDVFNENADIVDGIMKAIASDVGDNMNRLDEVEGALSGIKSNLGENGYLCIGDLLIQWGICTGSNEQASIDIDYPKSFESVYNVQVTALNNEYVYDAIVQTNSVLSIDVTTLTNSGKANQASFYWLAIGKK